MKDFSYITNSHPAYIENLYNEFIKNPESIDPDIRKFFEGFDFALSGLNGNPVVSAGKPAADIDLAREINVYRLILGYRNKGHLIATTNPIRQRRDRHANLDLAFFSLSEQDLDKEFYAGNLIGLGIASLRKILAHLQKSYAGNVGSVTRKRSAG